jgi:hypothetical protein
MSDDGRRAAALRGRRPVARYIGLAALLLLFLGLHGLYNWAIPLGEGPDEPGHLAYALFLASEGRLPALHEGGENEVPGEGHQPPLAYLFAVPAVAWLPPEQRQILLTANPRFVWAGGDEPGAFMRGSHELAPWPPLTLAWHLARAVSGLWGALAVLFTFLAAQRLRPRDTRFPLLAAALVALNPQLLFTTALVSNDGLLAALGAAMVWWVLDRDTRESWRREKREGEGAEGQKGRRERAALVGWGVVTGGMFGLALLTKQSALLFGPLLLWAGWRVAGGEWRRTLVVTAAWGLTALAVSGWWFLRNLRLYGDLLGLDAFQSEFATQPFAWGDPAAWAAALAQLFASFWARFGWMSLRPPPWTIWLYAGVCALALLGLASGLFRHGGAGGTEDAAGGHPARWWLSPWLAPALALGMALLWTLTFAGAAGLVAWQGRMLFPAIGAAGVALAAGMQNAKYKLHKPATMLHFACCIGLLGLALFMPLGVIRPGYSWEALAPREAQAALGNAVYARYAASWERGVALRGWRLDGEPVAGQPLPITLTWNSLEPVPRPWTVFVHLVDEHDAIVAVSNSQPRGGALPFPLWTPGDWMADTHTIPLPPGLAPGAYKLRVGLYRPDKGGERQRVWAADGSPLGDLAVVGTVVVR